jgi:hypothetical protein
VDSGRGQHVWGRAAQQYRGRGQRGC